MAQGDWTRASIQRDRVRVTAADALRAERLAHHVKHGDRMCDGSRYPFGTCECWGCRGGGLVGTETDGLE